jgi:hypothetical protein
MITHTGGCHCGRVRFEVIAPAKLQVLECNCSICSKAGYLHLIVPAARFSCFLVTSHWRPIALTLIRRSICSAPFVALSPSTCRVHIPMGSVLTIVVWTWAQLRKSASGSSTVESGKNRHLKSNGDFHHQIAPL